jgi:thioredoxin-related protein
MKKTISALAAALIVVGATGIAAPSTSAPLASVAFEGDDLWVADYDEALRLAKESGKDLLVDFTGSDWCGWCIKLDKEVFSQEAFIASAPNDFILCKLDYPQGAEAKAKVPNPERNQELSERFEIQGFPTILLLTNEEEVIAQTGYMAGGPEAYLPHLAEIRTTGKAAIAKVREIVEDFKKAPEERKLAVVERAVAAFAEMKDAAPARKLVDIVEQALVLDADNAKGLKLKALKALLAGGAANERVVAQAEAFDTDNTHGLLELCIEQAMRNVQDDAAAREVVGRVEKLVAGGKFVDTAKVGELCGVAAFWCAQFLDETERAVPLAKKALELGVDEQMRPMLEEIVGSAEGAREPARG